MKARAAAIIIALALVIGGNLVAGTTDIEAEKVAIEKTINDCIMWPFPAKNVDRLLSSLKQDSSFLMLMPDARETMRSYADFKVMIDNVYMNPKLQPIKSVLRDMRIQLSKSGDVAWFYCLLDDYGHWEDQYWVWLNSRWTGVLEKIDGKWKLVQMHFSIPTDNDPAAVAKAVDSLKAANVKK